MREKYEEIKNYFSREKYQKTIELIEKYLSDKNNGIFGQILDMYMNSLIEVGRFKDAVKVLEALNKVFPTYNEDYYTLSKYMMCNELDKAEAILLKNPNDPDNAYNLGRVYSLEGKYEEAKKYFLFTANNHESEEYRNKAREQLIKISNYYRLGARVIMDYQYFKKQNKKLGPKDVIYVSKVTDTYNAKRLENDKNISHKPFVIWRIVGDKIYAFPMCLYRDASYALLASRYPNIGLNRYFGSCLVVINEEDVCKVYDQVHDDDFDNSLISVYHAMCRQKPEDMQENMVFMQSMMRQKDINVGDVLCYYNHNEDKYHYYYIVHIDVDYFIGVPVSTKFENFQVLGDITFIERGKPVYEVYHVDNETKKAVETNIKEKASRK